MTLHKPLYKTFLVEVKPFLKVDKLIKVFISKTKYFSNYGSI